MGIKNSIMKLAFEARKHAPEILTVAGAVGTVVATVFACKQTVKAVDAIDETKEEIVEIRNDEELLGSEYKKELTKCYIKGITRVAKIYAGPAILLTGSVGAMVGSSVILKKRNIGLASAYATLDGAYKKYREAVVEKIGEEAEEELRHGVKKVKVEESYIDEKGKEKTRKVTREECSTEYSPYAKFFDQSSPAWSKDAELNRLYIQNAERFCNEKVKSQGYLFLNEVYRMLGITETKAGQCVGWVYDPEHPKLIDFGLTNFNSEATRRFYNGDENIVLLDFNVDGPILDTLPVR